MSKKKHQSAASSSKADDENLHGKSLYESEDVPYWEKLKRSETDYEAKMKDYTSTRGLSQKRPTREPIEPELFNQIMETINRRKSQIEEYRRENQIPHIENPEDFAVIQEVKTDYQKGREDYNMFAYGETSQTVNIIVLNNALARDDDETMIMEERVFKVDQYVERQKSKYKQARMADKFVEDVDRYEELLKTGIFEVSEGAEDDEHGEILLIPAKQKVEPALQKKKQADYRQKKVLGYVPAVTLEIPETASKPTPKARTTIDLKKDGSLKKPYIKMTDMKVSNSRGSKNTLGMAKSVSRKESRYSNISEAISEISIGTTTMISSLMVSESRTSSPQEVIEAENTGTNVKDNKIGRSAPVEMHSTLKYDIKPDTISEIFKPNKKMSLKSNDEAMTLRKMCSTENFILLSSDGESQNSSFSSEFLSNNRVTLTKKLPAGNSEVVKKISTAMNHITKEIDCKNKINSLIINHEPDRNGHNTFIVSLPGEERYISEEEGSYPVKETANIRRPYFRPMMSCPKRKAPRVRTSLVKPIEYQRFLTVLPITFGKLT